MPNKMNLTVLKLWTEALESGEYEQTTGTLVRVEEDQQGRPAGFCCLGVLCELAIEAGVPGIEYVPPVDYNDGMGPVDAGYKTREYARETGSLPILVQQWAGLDSADPSAEFGGRARPLSDWNDTAGKDFNEISEIIKHNFA